MTNRDRAIEALSRCATDAVVMEDMLEIFETRGVDALIERITSIRDFSKELTDLIKWQLEMGVHDD